MLRKFFEKNLKWLDVEMLTFGTPLIYTKSFGFLKMLTLIFTALYVKCLFYAKLELSQSLHGIPSLSV